MIKNKKNDEEEYYIGDHEKTIKKIWELGSNGTLLEIKLYQHYHYYEEKFAVWQCETSKMLFVFTKISLYIISYKMMKG